MEGLLSLAQAMKVNTTLNHIYIWGNQLEEPVCQVSHTHTDVCSFHLVTLLNGNIAHCPPHFYVNNFISPLFPFRPSESWSPAAACLQIRQMWARTRWTVGCFSLRSSTVWGDTMTGLTPPLQTRSAPPTAPQTRLPPFCHTECETACSSAALTGFH